MGLRDMLEDRAAKRQARIQEEQANEREEVELLTWERAARIATELSGSSDAKEAQLGQELARMAQEKSSFAGMLGYGEEPVAPQPEPKADESTKPSIKQEVAAFKHLFDSRDGQLCLFEDASGHLIAVRASRLV